MSLERLALRPGVVLDDTEYAAAGYAISTQWVRWWLGRPSPLGGCRTKLAGLRGFARQAHEWAAIDGTLLFALGTHQKLYVVRGSKLLDITPERSAGAFGSNPFETTEDSSVVVVNLTGHGAVNGDTVYIRGATAVGGLTIGGGSGSLGASPFTTVNGSTKILVTHTAHGLADNDRAYFDGVTAVAGIPDTDFEDPAGLRVQVLNANSYYVWVETAANATTAGGGTPTFEYAKPYIITMVVNGNEFEIDAGAAATATATGGGAGANYSFDLTSGLVSAGASAAGYGQGAYGQGLYGQSSAAGGDAPTRARLWALDHAGEDLIANISGGAIYHWSPWNLSARAKVLPNSPAVCLWAFVSPAREVVALGCTSTDGDFDPLCMRHTAPQAITTWTPAPDNTADELRAQVGSKFVSGMVTNQGIILWTDAAAYSAVEVGAYDQIYRLDIIGSSGLAGPNAAVDTGGAVFWFDPKLQVIEYSGGTPQEQPFPMREWIDQHVDRAQIEKIQGHADPKYPAACWLIPAASNECDTLLRFDYRESAGDPLAGWSMSVVDRTVWCGCKLWPYPLAVSSVGTLYEQEFGFVADGEPISWHVEWAPLESDRGDYTLQVSRFILDADREDDIELTLRGRNWPASTEQIAKGPYTIGPAAKHTDLQIAARQIGVRLGGQMTKRWRIGNARWELTEGARTGR